jgi:hypothetical protein
LQAAFVHALCSITGPWIIPQVSESIYGLGLDDGFRTPNLLRFVNEEAAYLSNANGGPRMFINMEDHLSLTTGVENTKFQVLGCTL